MSAPMSSKIPSHSAHKDPPVVRTLKPPPEIWELVHPVESKPYNPRLNFVTRLKLSATSLILVAMVIGLFLGVCIAVLKLRGAQKPTTVETPQPVQVGSTHSVNETANPAQSSAPPSYETVTQPTAVSASENPRVASSPSSKRKVRNAVEAQQPEIKAETTTAVRNNPEPARSKAPAIDRATDNSKKSSSDSVEAKPKSNTSLSPQVIAPLKSDTERKAKVIQWP